MRAYLGFADAPRRAFIALWQDINVSSRRVEKVKWADEASSAANSICYFQFMRFIFRTKFYGFGSKV
jgi:hypothetical protein